MVQRALLVLALLASLPSLARADEPDEESGKLVAVQQRRYHMEHELSFALGTLPLDAFYKGVTGDIAYTWHFSEKWAWEVVNAGYSQDVDTGLRTTLINNFGVVPTQFPEVRMMASSGLSWTPIYGKLAIENRSVVHAEVFLSCGGGADWVDIGHAHLVSPLAYGGVGMRVFLAPTWSVRFDARDAVLLTAARGVSRQQVLQLMLSLSVNIGSND